MHHWFSALVQYFRINFFQKFIPIREIEFHFFRHERTHCRCLVFTTFIRRLANCRRRCDMSASKRLASSSASTSRPPTSGKAEGHFTKIRFTSYILSGKTISSCTLTTLYLRDATGSAHQCLYMGPLFPKFVCAVILHNLLSCLQ